MTFFLVKENRNIKQETRKIQKLKSKWEPEKEKT